MICCAALVSRAGTSPFLQPFLGALGMKAQAQARGPSRQGNRPTFCPLHPTRVNFFFLSAPCSHDSDSSWRLINNQSSQPLASVDAALDRDGSDCPVCQKPEERGGVHMCVCVCARAHTARTVIGRKKLRTRAVGTGVWILASPLTRCVISGRSVFSVPVSSAIKWV